MRELQPKPAPSRRSIDKEFRIERNARCINCGECIVACIYGCHERSADDPRQLADPLLNCCRNCFACILRCPRGALSMHWNAAFLATGDAIYTADCIRSLLEQAEHGKIPVTGSGYGGLFDGPGYNNIWTDMSEIVRPTRDGIHGREHISTSVALGRMVRDLCDMVFDENGNLCSKIPPTREIPIPVLFGAPPFAIDESIQASLALAAAKLTTYTTIRADDAPERFKEYFNHLLIQISPRELQRFRSVLEWATIIELDMDGNALEAIAEARSINPHLLTIVRVPLNARTKDLALTLARDGAETIHIAAGIDGRGADGTSLIEGLRATHLRLVREGLRNQITLLASGGIAAAEHVPKTILLGADAVVVDLPLLIAMDVVEWDMRRPRLGACGETDPRWGATRVINLLLSWRDQLLEVLGAMGIRDVRRLRGEYGRAIQADQAREEFRARLEGSTSPPRERRVDPRIKPPGKIALERQSAPWRFATRIHEWRIEVDRESCTGCEICVPHCPGDVFRRTPGKSTLDEPQHGRCLGPDCLEQNCTEVCPFAALALSRDPVEHVLGDARWTAKLVRSTWAAGRRGEIFDDSSLLGVSGGGFDHLELVRAETGQAHTGPVDLSIPLNRRSDGPRLELPFPIYGGGMSYGSISLAVMVGRARAAARLGTLTCTGEGGYPEALRPYAAHVITQVATGLFGVREETIRATPMVEFKYAQGAKPGLGGHLLGEKNTREVAEMREAIPGTSLFSPFPFHSVYSVEDHKKHLDWIRSIQPDVLLSVKVSTPSDVDMVAVGSYHAGANVIHIDGAYGGTGAAPNIAKKNIAQPIEYATAQTHEFLSREGIRDEVVLIASGGIRTPEDALKAIALGADGVVIGTAELVAIDCVRCGNCERDRGCPIGIATTDTLLAPQLTSAWVEARITNLYRSWTLFMEKRLRQLGLHSARELRGRWDLLRYRPEISQRAERSLKGGAQ